MNKKEVLRYLAAPSDTKVLDEAIARADTELGAVQTPRAVWRRFPIRVENNSVTLAENVIESRDLARALTGCTEVCLLALTLGPGVDRLIRKAEIAEPPLVPVLQAVAAEKVEEYADRLQETIAREIAGEGLKPRPRFSPGYGDFPLEYQKRLFSLLEIEKKIGVTLTDACLMVPLKSVTALIGLAPEEADRAPNRAGKEPE